MAWGLTQASRARRDLTRFATTTNPEEAIRLAKGFVDPDGNPNRRALAGLIGLGRRSGPEARVVYRNAIEALGVAAGVREVQY